MNTAELKQAAKRFGADLIGIVSTADLAYLPLQENPLSIFPQATCAIVVGKRIPRGTIRGIEQGTEFANSFSQYGFLTMEDNFLSKTTYDITIWMEARGFEAVPLFAYDAPNGNACGVPVAPGKAAPNVLLNAKVLAQAAGLGEIGKNGLFLTPEFGPRQRFAMLLTDAELEPDPLVREPICDRCLECVRKCPGHALGGRRESINVEDRAFTWGAVDCGKCKVTHWGLNPLASPFVKKDLPGMNMEIDRVSYDWYAAFRLGFALAPRIAYLDLVSKGSAEHGQGGRPGSICGAVGCIQACNAHLEVRGGLRGGNKG